MVCSIQSIFQEAEGMLPKNFCFIVICFLQAFIEPLKPHDRLHGIHGDDPQVGEPENAAGRRQEIHAERTA